MFNAVVTFESDTGEPRVFRTTVDDSEPEVAARKAVFLALSEVGPRKRESLVLVLDKTGGRPSGLDRQG